MFIKNTNFDFSVPSITNPGCLLGEVLSLLFQWTGTLRTNQGAEEMEEKGDELQCEWWTWQRL